MHLRRAQNQGPTTEDRSQVAFCKPWLSLPTELFVASSHISSVQFTQSTELTCWKRAVQQSSLSSKHLMVQGKLLKQEGRVKLASASP